MSHFQTSSYSRPAHRMLARSSAAYGYGDGSNFPPSGAFGITSEGVVWKNSKNWTSDTYPAWSKATVWQNEYEGNLEELKAKNVGYRSSFEDAVAAAKARVGGKPEAKGGHSVPVGTWNDGTYTYEVRSATEVFTNGATFTPEHPRWGTFVSNLNEMQADGRLKKGRAPAKGSGVAPVAPVKGELPDTMGGESIMDKVWFWPVAILVPTAAVIGGILFWPSKKKVAAAPGAIPVASNPRRRGSKRRR